MDGFNITLSLSFNKSVVKIVDLHSIELIVHCDRDILVIENTTKSSLMSVSNINGL